MGWFCDRCPELCFTKHPMALISRSEKSQAGKSKSGCRVLSTKTTASSDEELTGSNNSRNGREMNNLRDHKDISQKDMVMN